MEKITNFKRRANEHLVEIYKTICDFTDGKKTKIFADLQQDIKMEFGDVHEICKEKHDDVFDESCPIVITGICFKLCRCRQFIIRFNIFAEMPKIILSNKKSKIKGNGTVALSVTN